MIENSGFDRFFQNNPQKRFCKYKGANNYFFKIAIIFLQTFWKRLEAGKLRFNRT